MRTQTYLIGPRLELEIVEALPAGGIGGGLPPEWNRPRPRNRLESWSSGIPPAATAEYDRYYLLVGVVREEHLIAVYAHEDVVGDARVLWGDLFP